MNVDVGASRAMGTTVAVTVVGGSMTATDVIDRIAELERSWSRFLPTSELSRLNAAGGAPTVVSMRLLTLVEHLVAACRITGGRFDPTMGRDLVQLGYDRTYRDLHDQGHDGDEGPGGLPEGRDASTPRGDAAITLLSPARTVVLAPGVQLDPGGLGKGLAADLVAADAMAAGAEGVLVDLGGDVVVRGAGPDGRPWRISVPTIDGHAIVELHDGAVATSDTTARTWRRNGRQCHHVLDPATRRPLARDLRVGVVAGAGWWAEAVATAVMVSEAAGDGWASEMDAELGIRALFVSEPSPEGRSTRSEINRG